MVWGMPASQQAAICNHHHATSMRTMQSLTYLRHVAMRHSLDHVQMPAQRDVLIDGLRQAQLPASHLAARWLSVPSCLQHSRELPDACAIQPTHDMHICRSHLALEAVGDHVQVVGGLLAVLPRGGDAVQLVGDQVLARLDALL